MVARKCWNTPLRKRLLPSRWVSFQLNQQRAHLNCSSPTDSKRQRALIAVKACIAPTAV
jgi:hypothetical protein